MKTDKPIKHFVIAFMIALACYVIFYCIIEHRRNRNGPWQITFTNSGDGIAQMIINQPRLGITNMTVSFLQENVETNVGVAMQFEQPRKVPYPVPYGQCIFMDTTFLPGTLTFQLFSHEIELLPRVLIIDQAEHAWVPDKTIALDRFRGTFRNPDKPRP